MHLKNFSLISTNPGRYVLTPTYDQVSTAIVMPEDTEELALSLNGYQKKLMRMDFMQAMEATGVSARVAERILNRFTGLASKWFPCIDESFVSEEQKEKFKALLLQRIKVIGS